MASWMSCPAGLCPWLCAFCLLPHFSSSPPIPLPTLKSRSLVVAFTETLYNSHFIGASKVSVSAVHISHTGRSLQPRENALRVAASTHPASSARDKRYALILSRSASSMCPLFAYVLWVAVAGAIVVLRQPVDIVILVPSGSLLGALVVPVWPTRACVP